MQRRTGYEVKWQRRAMDDATTRAAIEKIVAEPLTIDGAIKIALTSSSALQAEFETVGISLGDVAQASVLRNPEIDAELRFPLNGEASTLDLALMQDVLSLFTLGERREAAFADLNVARMQAAGAVVDLIAEVRIAFYRVQADQQLLELRQTTVAGAGAAMELSQRLREAGNVTALALAQDEILFDEAKLSLARVEVQVATNREALNALLGLSGEVTSWRVEAQLDAPPETRVDTGDLESVSIRTSLDLQAARWRLKSLAAAIGIARVESWLPHIAVGASAEREKGGDWAVGPALSFGLPIFDRNQGARAGGHARLRQAQRRYTSVATTIRADARAASMRLKAAAARVQYLYEVILPLRQRVLGETLKLYNAMSTSPYELLQAKREQVASGADYVEALYEYWSAHASVQQIIQGRMSDAMAPQSGPSRESTSTSSRGH